MAHSTEAFATRLPEEDAERLKEVVRTTDLTESDVLGRSVQRYLDEGLDGIQAFKDRSIEKGDGSDGSESAEQPEAFVDRILRDLE